MTCLLSMAKRHAKLRVCASCEWIFTGGLECPKCQFCSYGARFVYGRKAYTYQVTQEPWKSKKMFSFELSLDREIKENNLTSRPADTLFLEKI